MADPFEVLELPKNAGEGEIRKRYLELVRAFPPEQAPERFAEVHAAYQALRDPAARLESQIFDIECEGDSLEALAADLRKRLRDVRLPVETLLSLADSS
jgi:curved DNA-binding protein CbpA